MLYIVDNIDKVAPDAPTASADVTTPTNGDVTVTAVEISEAAARIAEPSGICRA